MPHSIRTDRLLLRPWTIRDAGALYRAKNDFDVVKMTATWPWPVSEPYVRARLEKSIGLRNGPKAIFAIVPDGDADASPGELIGSIGGGPSEEDAETAGVGYMLGRKWWGRGYALEALNAWCAHMFRSWKVRSIVGEHWIDNPASGKIMAKVGFAFEGPVAPLWCEARQTEIPGVRYRLTRP